MKTEIQMISSKSITSAGKDMMSESKFFMGYSRWLEAKGGYETWGESVERVMAMHREKYADKMTPALDAMMVKAEKAYKSQQILGAQRALQFGGAQMKAHNARMYNCSASHADRPAFFQEAMYLLLCGCGVGFSVQKHHIEKLPGISPRSGKRVKAFQVPDSIEGWADAFGVLLSSYFETDGAFSEYKGAMVHFDYSKVRPKGAFISGGFKAPGPDPLRAALIKCEALIEKSLAAGETRLRSIVVYDFIMHMSDAVLAGGVRRSATLCMFSKDDADMLAAKTGNWFVDNPQRGRSNNSVVLQRDELTRDEWAHIMKSVRDFGEPGFIFVDNKEFTFNPCVEIGMLPVTEDGVSGFQFCNLAEINGGLCESREKLLQACEAAAIMCTLQAGYTDFKYLTDATRQITERESLIGVSITGWMNNPKVLFDLALQKEGAELVKFVNKQVAAIIGINPAARTTCAKPSGNASVLLGTASGIHGEHAPRYFRNVQMSKEDDVAKLIEKVNPKMVELSVWSAAGTDLVVSFPVVTNEGSIYKSDLMGVKQLDYVKIAQQNWIEAGTNIDLCVDTRLRHNISNTISVDDWAEVEQYIFDNRESFAGISLLSSFGDKGYVQAPFTEVPTAEQILDMYGEASMFASGLIVEGLHAFNNNLWSACDTAMGFGQKLDEENASDLLKRDWVRRFKKFADSFFAGDLTKTSFCLKDCFNLHKWVGIEKTMKVIDFSAALAPRDYVDINTLGSQACAGGICELTF
jgi:ribonucleoside-diphosphate reductase alpha chain